MSRACICVACGLRGCLRNSNILLARQRQEVFAEGLRLSARLPRSAKAVIVETGMPFVFLSCCIHISLKKSEKSHITRLVQGTQDGCSANVVFLARCRSSNMLAPKTTLHSISRNLYSP